MQKFENRIALTGDEVIGNICTKANYDWMTRVGHMRVLRRGCKGTPALIDYESMPDRYKKLVIERFGDPVKVLSQNQLAGLVKHDLEARDFYNSYITIKDQYLPAERISEYIANAELLNAIGVLAGDKKAFRKLLGGSQGNIWQSISRTLADLDKVKFPHSLPENPARLRDKFNNYKLNGYASLIHSGYGNRTAEKLSDPAKMWVLARWANMVDRVVSIEHLFALYNKEAANQGWKILESSQTIKNYLFSEGIKDMWWGYRYGELQAKEKFSMQHSTRLPNMRDSLWYSDGTKLNYFYLEDGQIKTISVYEVMDSYSEVLLGYHISRTEDFEAQYKAYKMAAQFAGHRPYQLGMDNQGGHKKLENAQFLSNLAKLSIRTQPYNGKSKTIENAFGRFQEQILKQDWFFTGQNIQAKSIESKANMEFILANKSKLPSLQDIMTLYKERRAQWNEAPHPKTGEPRINMYRNSFNPDTPELTMLDMVDLFWMMRPEPVTVTAFGITFSERKVKRTYLVYKDSRPDQLWLRKNIDKPVYIKFDPEDFSTIYLYEKDATGLRFLTEAHEKITVSRGKQEQDEFESSYIATVNTENKRIRVQRDGEMDAILREHNMHPEDYGLNKPGLKGISKKDRSAGSGSIGRVQKKVSEMVPVDLGDSDLYSMY